MVHECARNPLADESRRARGKTCSSSQRWQATSRTARRFCGASSTCSGASADLLDHRRAGRGGDDCEDNTATHRPAHCRMAREHCDQSCAAVAVARPTEGCRPCTGEGVGHTTQDETDGAGGCPAARRYVAPGRGCSRGRWHGRDRPVAADRHTSSRHKSCDRRAAAGERLAGSAQSENGDQRGNGEAA